MSSNSRKARPFFWFLLGVAIGVSGLSEIYEFSWDPPEPNSTPVHHYTVYLQDNATQEWVAIGSTAPEIRSFQWENFLAGEYRFTVTASSADGLESERSNICALLLVGAPFERLIGASLTGKKANSNPEEPAIQEHLANLYFPANVPFQFFRVRLDSPPVVENSFDLKNWQPLQTLNWINTGYESFSFSLLPIEK